MIQGGRVADGITLREHFEKADKLQEIGGLCIGNVVQPPGFKLFFPHRFA